MVKLPVLRNDVNHGPGGSGGLTRYLERFIFMHHL